MCATSLIFKPLPKVSNDPLGENLPNLVTLQLLVITRVSHRRMVSGTHVMLLVRLDDVVFAADVSGLDIHRRHSHSGVSVIKSQNILVTHFCGTPICQISKQNVTKTGRLN
jgi:hypothetical protein